MTRSGRRWLGAMALALAVVAPGRPAAGADRPALSEPRIAAQVKPGTVLIVHDEVASIDLPRGELDHALLESLIASDQEIVALRGRDPAAAQQKGVQRYLLADPARFVKVASMRTLPADAVFTGSGAVVSGDGYIVTNAHVVAPDEASVRRALKNSVNDEVNDDLEELLSDIDDTYFDGSMSDDIQRALGRAYVSFLDQHSDLGPATSSTAILSGAADPSEAKAKGRPAEVVRIGEEYPAKDVAVLKIQATNLYTLPLGDDAEAVSGTKVFAVGYPGEATFDSGAPKGSQLEPSISSGTVSARRTVEGGYSVIQHNAAIQHGSSGGPMVDEQGRIVGLTTAGSGEQGTFYFSVPVTLVKEFLRRGGVRAGPSPATGQYLAALDAFDQRHYKKALARLQTLDRTSPGLPFVADKIADAQKKIDAGDDVPEHPFPVVRAALAAGVLVLVLLGLSGLGLGLGLRRRKIARRGRAPAVVPTAHGMPFGPPPPPPPAFPGSWAPPAGPALPAPRPPSGGFVPPPGR